jgi:hypothetical protein
MRFLVFAGLFLLSGSVMAQLKCADFSGTYKQGSSTVKITQDKCKSITYVFNSESPTTYPFNGTPVDVTMRDGLGGTAEVSLRSYISGNRVISFGTAKPESYAGGRGALDLTLTDELTASGDIVTILNAGNAAPTVMVRNKIH